MAERNVWVVKLPHSYSSIVFMPVCSLLVLCGITSAGKLIIDLTSEEDTPVTNLHDIYQPQARHTIQQTTSDYHCAIYHTREQLYQM